MPFAQHAESGQFAPAAEMRAAPYRHFSFGILQWQLDAIDPFSGSPAVGQGCTVHLFSRYPVQASGAAVGNECGFRASCMLLANLAAAAVLWAVLPSAAACNVVFT